LLWIEAATIPFKLLLFSGWFAVVSNLIYVIAFIRKDLKLAGSAISHIGFGIMLVGIMASGPNQRVISKNPFLMEGLTNDEELKRTTLLLFENTPMAMENYRLTYVGDTINHFTRTFYVDYEELDKNGTVKDRFRLEPTILYDRSFTKIAITNPSTKHYPHKDIFTVIMSIPEEEASIESKQAKEDSLKYRILPTLSGERLSFLDTVRLTNPDTTLIRKYEVALESFKRQAEHPDYAPEPNDLGVSATFLLRASHYQQPQRATAAIVLRDGLLYQYPAQVNELNTRVKIDESIFDELLIDENQLNYQEFVVKPGEIIDLEGQKIRFVDFLPNPDVPHYRPMEGDISVSAILMAENPAGDDIRLDPIFIIRDKQAVRARDESRELGIYANFVNLNPQTNEATLYLAKTTPQNELRVPLAIAPRSSRNDWIALQAIEFPGINLFWMGSILMLMGLAFSMVVRLRRS
ncbi:MAG: cytochrome c assembly protein, partial [Bacteroidota bacterium]